MTLTAGLTWPSIARTPRAPLASAVARLIFESRHPAAAGDRAATPTASRSAAGTPPTAHRCSSWSARRPSSPGSAATPRSASARPTWPATGGPATGTDLADLLTPFAARLTTLVPQPLQRLRAVVDERLPAHQENTLEGSREQHQRPLRPQQRAVRGVPRPDDDLLRGLVRARASTSRRAPRGGAAAQDRRHPRPRRRRRGHPGAGDRHRLGRPADPRRAARRRTSPPSPSRRAARAWPASAWRRPGCPSGSTCGCRTTARSRGSSTRSSASR